MSFKNNGEDWTPQTTSEHTKNVMNRLNAILQEEGITDDNGDIIQLSANFANALYLLTLAAGNRLADLDAKLSAAIDSFNVEVCDDQQIENLLPIAAVSRNPGSYSTLELMCTASEDGAVVIPAGTKAPFENVNFVVKTDYLISAGTTQAVETVCDTIGPVSVLTGEVTAFENTIANLDQVINEQSSVPGVAAETTNSLRQRIINGDTVKFSLDGVKNALEELTGISYAKTYFNYNTTTTITLPGGVVLQPRTAYIVVYGESDQVAETYASYMNAPTQNAPGATTTAHSQNYVTQSGQELEIKYDTADEQIVHVKIVLQSDSDFENQVKNQLRRDLLVASSGWEIGQAVTSMNTSQPFSNITYAKIAYTQVSSDGETWQNYLAIPCNTIPRITDATIEIERLT